jgi:hypothetical protein
MKKAVTPLSSVILLSLLSGVRVGAGAPSFVALLRGGAPALATRSLPSPCTHSKCPLTRESRPRAQGGLNE